MKGTFVDLMVIMVGVAVLLSIISNYEIKPDNYIEPTGYAVFGDNCIPLEILDTNPIELVYHSGNITANEDYPEKYTKVKLLEHVYMVNCSFGVLSGSWGSWDKGKIIYYPKFLLYSSESECIDREMKGVLSQVIECKETGLENGYCGGVYSKRQYSSLTLKYCKDVICPDFAPYVYYMNSYVKCRCIDDPYKPIIRFNPYPISPGKDSCWYEIENRFYIVSDVMDDGSIGRVGIKYDYIPEEIKIAKIKLKEVFPNCDSIECDFEISVEASNFQGRKIIAVECGDFDETGSGQGWWKLQMFEDGSIREPSELGYKYNYCRNSDGTIYKY